MIKQVTTKGSWGGARENSGRKKKYVHRVTFSATEDVAAILKDVDSNMSDFICACILQANK